jgi:NTE family protein
VTTAFVLSGGSNLGAAQVGMLKALFEAGIVPSSVVGTSVGAINAAAIAGNPTAEGVDHLEQIWLGLGRANIFPFHPLRGFLGFIGKRDSLFSSHALRQVVESNLGFRHLEDARIPISVVATEIRTGAEMVFRSGPAVDRIMASAAIPGIFPAVSIDGEQYMDGGVADNTPISPPISDGADTVDVLSSGSACGLSKAPRSALGIALQALAVLVQKRVWQEVTQYSGVCQMYVVPPLCPIQINPLDFSRSREIMAQSYESTQRWLAAGAPSAIHLLKPHTH